MHEETHCWQTRYWNTTFSSSIQSWYKHNRACIRSKGIGGKGHHISKLSNPSADTWHVKSLQYPKSINANAIAGEGFGSRWATYHKRTNQHSTKNPMQKRKEWCFRNRYRCPSRWLHERKPLYILFFKSTGQQETWRPWLLQHHSETSSTHY